jgi:hypothetical protein
MPTLWVVSGVLLAEQTSDAFLIKAIQQQISRICWSEMTLYISASIGITAMNCSLSQIAIYRFVASYVTHIQEHCMIQEHEGIFY